MKAKRPTVHCAPRLASRERREPNGGSLPPILKFALRQIANEERRSLSWVIEEILIDWARHDRRLSRYLRGEAVAYKPLDPKTEKVWQAVAAAQARRKPRREQTVEEALAAVAAAASR